MSLRVHFLAERFSEEHKCGYCCYVSNHINTGGLQCMPASNNFTAFAYFVRLFSLLDLSLYNFFLLFWISGLFSSFLQYFDAIAFVVIFEYRSFQIYFFSFFFLFAIPIENASE